MHEQGFSHQQWLERGDWEMALQQWVDTHSSQVAGLCLAAVLREETPPEQHAVLDDIARCYQEHDNALRWRIFNHFAEDGFGSPVGALALALFWSKGSLAPEGVDPVYPDPALVPQMLHTTMLLLAAQLNTSPVEGARLLLNRCMTWEVSQ
ncbi:DUF6931 family protein [Mangrovibacter yixingensis]|uniref:DUF6931 family protein n=1 Tax=Mangrovibacter yixingensis TaxID=1529639 RepID=UPI001CFEFC40|nr:hypothetical protein [Mangrovibacter yixingensis]